MKIKQLFLTVLLLCSGVVTWAQMQLPVDTSLRTGKLSNGLTYYIKYNNWPEHRANFYIAQRVGSIQEEESQRGLAHFLEHMAFNGSDHFKSNGLIRYLESIGVQFGADLNAYTAIDRTVYNINNVPTTRQSSLDSCLLILRDWSTGLSLEQEEIDKERGVIHEEWRMRTSADSRLFERNLPALYPGSKYGLRYPIGLMSVIDNFERKELVDYYHKWYHPANQGIIVVGDVDVDKIEAEIKRLFGGIKNPENAAPVVDEAVPDNATPIVIIDKDKELRVSSVDLMIKQDVFPDSLKNTPFYYVNDYMTQAICSMLNNRLAERALNPDCPYVNAGADYGQFIYAKTKDCFAVSATPKEQSQVSAALKAISEEVLRAVKFGFTATEYKRYQQDYLSGLDQWYNNRDKISNAAHYGDILPHFLDNAPYPGIDLVYQLKKQVVPMIPVEAINEGLKELNLESDSNVVIVNFNTEKEGMSYPTKAELLGAVKAARSENLTAYVDNVKDEPLIKQLPKAGKIVKEQENKVLGFKTITLQNGVEVSYKKTDFRKDQVLMKAEGGAGSSKYNFAKEKANIKLFDEAISSSGLGGFTNKQLEKALAGVIAGTSLSMANRSMSLSGNSSSKDIEKLFQLVYLTFTDITKDTEEWDNMIKSQEVMLANRKISPEVSFSDSLNATLYNHDPRTEPLTEADLKAASYDRILAIAKERLSNAKGWRFVFVGNFDEDSLKTYATRYLGSLSAAKKADVGTHGPRVPGGVRVNEYKRKMETPKAIGVIVWTNSDMPVALEQNIKADIAGQILDMEYTQSIREDSSAAYTVGAFGGADVDVDQYQQVMLLAQCPMKPEKEQMARRILNAEPLDMMNTVDADKLDKVKKLMLKRADDSAKQNSYWLNTISTLLSNGMDTHTDYKKIVEAQTPETIKAFMKEFMKPGNKVEVVMLPEE